MLTSTNKIQCDVASLSSADGSIDFTGGVYTPTECRKWVIAPPAATLIDLSLRSI